MSKVHHLTSPFSEEVIRSLHAGDTVYFDRPLFGIRDLTQIHIFDHNNPPPVSLEGMPCIHTAPSLRKVGDKWEKICVGTTTSTRMDRFTPGLIGQYGVRAIIGKGGLYHGSLAAMKKYGAVYLAIVGGAGALLSKCITSSEIVAYEDLGTEAIRKLTVVNLPVIVVIDSKGNNLYETAVKEYRKI